MQHGSWFTQVANGPGGFDQYPEAISISISMSKKESSNCSKVEKWVLSLFLRDRDEISLPSVVPAFKYQSQTLTVDTITTRHLNK